VLSLVSSMNGMSDATGCDCTEPSVAPAGADPVVTVPTPPRAAANAAPARATGSVLRGLVGRLGSARSPSTMSAVTSEW